MSICWKCGQDEGTAHYNGKGCPTGLASIVGSPCFITDPTSTLEVVHSGLEKIKPIAHELTRMSFTTADMNIALKLNEVIEKVNLITEVMNKELKK